MRPIKKRNQLSSTSTMSEHIQHSSLVGSKVLGFARLRFVGCNNAILNETLRSCLCFLSEFSRVLNS